MKKQLYKITPSDISMMVEQIINEIGDTKKGSYILGALAGRADDKMTNAVKRYNAGEEEKSFNDYKKASQTYVDAKDRAKHKNSFEQGELCYKNPKLVNWKEVANKIRECAEKSLNEAVDGGWEVDSNEAQEAYQLACEKMGKETVDAAIIDALSSDELAASLAFIFRMYDFREWEEYQAQKYADNYESEDEEEY